MLDGREQVHPGAVSAFRAAAGLAVHRDRAERCWDRWWRGEDGQPGVQDRVQDLGIDQNQHPADRGQTRRSANDPEARAGPWWQVRGPTSDRSKGPRARHDGRDRQGQDRGQLMSAPPTVPSVGDRGQHVPDRDRHVMNRAYIDTSEGICGPDERRYRRGHGKAPIDRDGHQAPTTIPAPAVPAQLLPRHRRVSPAPRRHTDFEQALPPPTVLLRPSMLARAPSRFRPRLSQPRH